MKRYIWSLVFLAMAGAAQAQSVQDYFFKSWDLSYVSAAALTQEGGLKGNLYYQQDRVGSVNSNEGGLLQLHTNVGRNHGVGITMQSTRSGILRSSNIGAGYAYRVQLAQNQTLSAGGRFSYFRYSLDRAAVTHADVADPILYGDMFQQNSLLLSTGILYEWGLFRLAVNAPELVPLEGGRYAKKHFSAYTDYSFLLDNWQIRPNVYYEQLAALGGWFEANLYTSFKDRVAVEVGYTSEHAIRAKASVNYSAFTVGYGYNAGKSANEGSSSQAGHRIYLGYTFGDVFEKRKKRRDQEEQEKQELETIIKESAQLIEDYKKMLAQSEEAAQKALQPQPDTFITSKPNPTPEPAPPLANENVKPSPKTPSVMGGFYVAIAAFDTMSGVAAFMDQNRKAGFTPKVLYHGGAKKFRVYYNNYKNYREALKARNQLRSKGFKDSWIFEVK
ncbi:PorP/SprF family type IX secretion system membrane protein [Rufibacter quisquiliarum]|uniref:Type IX secretion system PorP/SprF family membrane protein n=1 Tax=Rufibacter quisquiliarum TaxID=1549639 RepID=A0A839GLA4_9BACT|nr:type IX secretion system membrane protein PorP/SprF [Rufibacter quisquiliarum]MBA9079622.1 type IX secretion system PorP/SprF family membrane protein [Rufibacter quisquiliarum]